MSVHNWILTPELWANGTHPHTRGWWKIQIQRSSMERKQETSTWARQALLHKHFYRMLDAQKWVSLADPPFNICSVCLSGRGSRTEPVPIVSRISVFILTIFSVFVFFGSSFQTSFSSFFFCVWKNTRICLFIFFFNKKDRNFHMDGFFEGEYIVFVDV